MSLSAGILGRGVKERACISELVFCSRSVARHKAYRGEPITRHSFAGTVCGQCHSCYCLAPQTASDIRMPHAFGILRKVPFELISPDPRPGPHPLFPLSATAPRPISRFLSLSAYH